MKTKDKMHQMIHNRPIPAAHGHVHHHFTSIRAARIFAITQTILGGLCIFATDHIHGIFPIVLGLLMMAHGACDVYRGIVTQEYNRADTKLTSQGIVTALLGIVILFHHQNADQIVGAIWGVIGLGKGSETLNIAICKCAAKKPFAWKMIHGVIELALGILLLLDPLTAVEHHLIILGIELVVIGIQAVMEAKKVISSEITTDGGAICPKA